MPEGKSDMPQSWLTIAITVVALLTGAQWMVSDKQFGHVDKAIESINSGITRRENDLKARIAVVETQQQIMLSKMARDPVEAETFRVTNKASDDKITLLLNAINDINRQIAAVVFGNDAIRKIPAAPPP